MHLTGFNELYDCTCFAIWGLQIYVAVVPSWRSLDIVMFGQVAEQLYATINRPLERMCSLHLSLRNQWHFKA
jgi:hypothetical protein